MPAARKVEVVNVAGREVQVSNPGKVFFPEAGYTKWDLVRYYLDVAPGALAAVGGRPLVLKRYVDGIGEPAFYQKRAPKNRPDWLECVEFRFPSGRTAEELVLRDAAGLVYVVNLGCVDLHPHPVRAQSLDHPDELRVDLDPVPGVGWTDVTQVAQICREILADHGLVSFPKTSGSRGVHLNVRLHPRWTFGEVRRAALALAREAERRAPTLATSAWWKEERHGVFIDYNQNARDRTTAAAYSVRPLPDARVSTPVTWDELAVCSPADFTLATVPARFARLGDLAAGLDAAPGTLDSLLELAARHEAEGMRDAPYPPQFPKGRDEPTRAPPSRRRAQAPLVTIARARRRDEAVAALEVWRTRHPEIAARLAAADILVDTMRGRSSTWTRVRVNLRAIPESERPAADEPLVVDFDLATG
jgi:bifunctional non-homologous end joining protein LigD